ncbi:Linear gramicidin synthase subunit D [Pseudomonas aeruginosa]|nr:Linear gramicidin synthase subunit D [Pseudomonas aeruginosa]
MSFLWYSMGWASSGAISTASFIFQIRAKTATTLHGQMQNQAYQAPRNELEETLARIWAEVLKVERVGMFDNFFELGGHSLLATQIASRVQKALQRNVPLRAMFECTTVEELASYIESLAPSEISEQKAERLNDLMSKLEML